MKLIKLVSLLLAIVSVTACTQPIQINTSDDTVQAGSDNQREPVKAEGPPKVHGWIPHWNINAGIDTMERFPVFNSVSPVWYEVGSEGILLPVGSSHDVLSRYAEQTGTRLLPSIASFDHNTFSSLSATDELLEAHITAIVSEVIDNGYDGIDLDYESIKLADKYEYMTLISELSDRLHAQDKLLSVTVLAKWGDDVRYGYRPETREVQQWDEIAVYVDQLRIMTYDFTYQGAEYPGPIAPDSWVKNVLDYAVSKTDPYKIVLGVPTYAYEWYQPDSASETGLQFEPNGLTNPEASDNSARSYTYSTIETIISSYDGELSEFQGESIYRYSKSGESRVVVYLSNKGLLDRYKIAEDYGIAGVSFWRLGDEGDLYNQLSDYLAIP